MVSTSIAKAFVPNYLPIAYKLNLQEYVFHVLQGFRKQQVVSVSDKFRIARQSIPILTGAQFANKHTI